MRAVIRLLLTVISTINASFIDSLSLSNFITNGSLNRDQIVKEAKKIGPRIVGSLLSEIVSEDCTIPWHGKDGSGSSFDLGTLIPQALHEKVQVEVIDYDVVCLNQGYHRRGHSSASVIVKYSTRDSEGSLSNAIKKQIPLVCIKGRWLAPFTDSGSPNGTLDTPTRRDCQMCPPTEMFVEATDAEHCLACPKDCSSKRCRIDGECCEVFDLYQRCASNCPKHSHKGRNRQCRCNKGYRTHRGVCKKPSKRRCYCRNGGKCVKGINKCVCPEGYTGRFCSRCALPDCLQCRYDSNTKKATCVKKKQKDVCRIKFIKEPPKFRQLGCNPFDGSGYTIQCALEVPAEMKDSVHLLWGFTTASGEVIDLRSAMLQSFVKITERTSLKNDKAQISTLVTTHMQNSGGFLGGLVNIKDMVFQYLRGGSLFCVPKINGREARTSSNFLTLPMEKPNLQPCEHDTVYVVSSDKCVMHESSTRKESESNQGDNTVETTSEERNEVRIPEDAAVQYDESKVQIEASEVQDDSAGDDDLVDEDNFDPGHRPYFIILGTLGGFFLLVGLIIPIVGIIALYLKKKYAKPVQPSLSNDEYISL